MYLKHKRKGGGGFTARVFCITLTNFNLIVFFSEWTVFNPEGKRYACNAFLVSRMVNVGTKTIVDPYSDSGVLVLDTGCTNWGFFKYARTMMAQQAAV